MHILRLVIFLTFAITLSGFAHAHMGGGGEDRVVGDYIIDFNYLPEDPIAGGDMQFSVGLVENESKEIADFENAWVRISRGNKVLFASTLEKSISENVSFLYNFAEPGIHEITVRFQKYSEEAPEIRLAETITETSFNVNIEGKVAERKSRVSGDLIVGFIVGTISGIIILLILKRKNR